MKPAVPHLQGNRVGHKHRIARGSITQGDRGTGAIGALAEQDHRVAVSRNHRRAHIQPL